MYGLLCRIIITANKSRIHKHICSFVATNPKQFSRWKRKIGKKGVYVRNIRFLFEKRRVLGAREKVHK